MLRGVNKSIIEITQTDNQYFEKAILFVRQSHRERDKRELEERAREFVKSMAEDEAAPPQQAAAPTAAATQTKVRIDLKSAIIKAGVGAAVVAAAAMMVFL